MILIRKGNEPPSLTHYRKIPFAYYDGCNKRDIREQLLKEQGYLCAYCMRRIDIENMKIEHWQPEAILTESEKLDYSNMLAVCKGHMEGMPGKYDTCDASKGDTEITIDPRLPEHIALIHYGKGSGEIFSNDPAMNKDLTEVLNLNCSEQLLPQNRRAALQRVIDTLRKKQKIGNWKRADVQKFIQKYENPDTRGFKTEYSGIILWYLKKKNASIACR